MAVDLQIGISFLRGHVDPDITVSLDQTILLTGTQSIDRIDLGWTGDPAPGPHRLTITYHNMQRPSEDAPEMAVLIDSVKFQSVDHDWRVLGRYRPCYPQCWITEQTTLGQPLDDEIHSTYLGWNGEWYLDFETPIYRWMHRKMHLGWLI